MCRAHGHRGGTAGALSKYGGNHGGGDGCEVVVRLKKVSKENWLLFKEGKAARSLNGPEQARRTEVATAVMGGELGG